MSMTVEELSRRSGVPANTVRYYTRIGLLRPRRHPQNGYRLFSDEDLRQLTFTVEAKTLGLSLSEIRGLIETSNRGAPTGALARRILEKRVVEIRSTIEELNRSQERMESALAMWSHVPERVSDRACICPFISMVTDSSARPVASDSARRLRTSERLGTVRRSSGGEAHVGD